MPAKRRTPRDERRRRLGQNFLSPVLADQLVAQSGTSEDDLVVDLGAGSGAVTFALADRGAEVIALEVDEAWAAKLRREVERRRADSVQVITADARTWSLPNQPFRVVANLAFGSTTATLHRLLDRPTVPLVRADLIVQWEVAKKRASVPPTTLISTIWAPWWDFHLGRRVPAEAFRPVPSVDAGFLTVTRRDPPLLPPAMADEYADFVRRRWPFRLRDTSQSVR